MEFQLEEIVTEYISVGKERKKLLKHHTKSDSPLQVNWLSATPTNHSFSLIGIGMGL